MIIEVNVSAHQIPSSSSDIADSRIASGIRALVREMLITLHRWVFPSPDSAPTVINSTHRNGSLNPTMIRYPTDIIKASFGFAIIPLLIMYGFEEVKMLPIVPAEKRIIGVSVRDEQELSPAVGKVFEFIRNYDF